MGSNERDVKLNASVEGADKSAEDIKKISDAQRGIGDAAQESAQKTTDASTASQDAAGSTQELRLEQDALKSVLSSIHPALGGMADGLINMIKLTGQLGEQNVNLGGILKGVRKGIKGNSAAFKTLLAGGAVVGGIIAIAKAWELVKASIEEATKATTNFQATQDELADRRRSTEEKLAESLSLSGKSTPENLERAVKLAEQARRSGFGESGISAAGIIAPAGGSLEDTKGLAAAIERGLVDPNDPNALEVFKNVASTDEGLSSINEQANFRKQTASHEALRKRALQQVESFGVVSSTVGPSSQIQDIGPQGDILKYLKEVEGLTGEDAQDRIKFMQQTKANREAEAGGDASPFSFARTATDPLQSGDLMKRIFGGSMDQAEGSLDRLSKESPGSGQPLNITINNSYPNQRVYKNRSGLRGGRPATAERDLSGRS